MRIIFCCDPLNTSKVDIFFENEYNTAKDLGFTVDIINEEELVDFDNPTKALRKVQPSANKETAIYRGWILKPKLYEVLYESLKEKNIELINSPMSYKHCLLSPRKCGNRRKLTNETSC